ncbi:MAG TPA: serine/threonine-protein kinase [Polyangiaceae bacterium]
MAPPLKLRCGQILEDRFLLLEEIGHGGMSTVFKAEDLDNDRQLVAVKVPLPQYSSGVGSWSMSQREAEIGETLCHPYVLRFIACSPLEQRGYVVTEFVAGTTLATRVGKGKHLAEPEALRIANQLCEAVEYLHEQGFVHYDLKPGNVILCEDGTLRLIDFGTAHRTVTRRLAFAAAAPAIASSDYVAPEQIRRQRGRPSVDIYALGAMLYEMLTGHAPFEDDDPFVVASARQIGDPRPLRGLNAAISVQAEEIVLRALRRDPSERYLSVAALKADLDDPAQVHVSGLCERLVEVTPWRKRLRLLRFVAFVGLLPVALMVASFRVLWWYLERKP